MARKTILVCDNCSNEVEEGKGAVMRITFNDARRGAKQADLCDSVLGEDARPGSRAPRPAPEVRGRIARPVRGHFALFAQSRVE